MRTKAYKKGKYNTEIWFTALFYKHKLVEVGGEQRREEEEQKANMYSTVSTHTKKSASGI